MYRTGAKGAEEYRTKQDTGNTEIEKQKAVSTWNRTGNSNQQIKKTEHVKMW